MQLLKPDDINDFIVRFVNFYDAILHNFSCDPGSKTSCELSFEAKDEAAASGWSRVKVRLDNVTSWKFAVSMNCAFYIMSSGVHLHYQDDLFYMSVNGIRRFVRRYRELSGFRILFRRARNLVGSDGNRIKKNLKPDSVAATRSSHGVRL